MSAVNESGLADAYAGERIFLIGNGPSLAETPLDALEDEYTMAMNRIDLIYDAVDWRPDFYTLSRNKPIIQGPLRKSLDAHINMDNVVVFLNELQRDYVPSDQQIKFFNLDSIFTREQGPNDLSVAEIQDVDIEWLEQFWSYDPREIVYGFHAMYKCVQLAMWMGFEEIYILGADLGYGTSKYMIINNNIDPANYAGRAMPYLVCAWKTMNVPSAILNGIAFKIMNMMMKHKLLHRFVEDTNNHFDGSYINTIIPLHKDVEHRKAHMVIKRICESNGLNVYNATIGGKLEVYQRVNLTEVLRQ